jgi:hypothetical protein
MYRAGNPTNSDRHLPLNHQSAEVAASAAVKADEV